MTAPVTVSTAARPHTAAPGRRGTTSPLAAAVVIAGVLLAAVPLAYLASVSLMSRNELTAGLLVSPDPRWSNWAEVLTRSHLVQAVLNSVVTATGGAVLTLALALPGAWAIVRHGAGGRALTATLMSPWLLPPVVAVVPLFALLRWAGLINSVGGLVLVYGLINVPVAVWLLRGFLRRIPVEVDEAAQLDGAGPVRVLAQIVLPLAAPSLAAVGLIVGLLNYSELLLASFLTQDAGAHTLPVLISLFLGERVADFGQIAAASVIGILPVVAIAVAFQRRLVDGLTAGAVK